MLKKVLAGILICMFGGLSTALWGAFQDINSVTIKHRSLEGRVNRIDSRLDKRLERIEKKLDEIRGLL